jgi:uncharacterized protein DUF1707
MLVRMEPRDGMRAGDADRQAVADKLRSALDEGRLDLGEYDERLQKAYGAKTYADLDGLLADLPGTVPPSRAQLAPLADTDLVPVDQRNPTGRWLVHTWDGYFTTVGIVVAIWAVISLMTRDWQYFWPGWVAGPWGAVLLVVTITGLSSGEPAKWAAKNERERQEKNAEKDEAPDDDA